MFLEAGLPGARPRRASGGSYVPTHAHVSPRLRSKILQGQYVNLVSLILPSPEVDQRVASSAGFTAIFKSNDPRLSKDLSIGEFLAAFSVYRDVLCSVYPDRRIELNTYLSLIADLNLKYGRSLSYQYHKAFATKAATVLSQSGICLDWSVLDTELLLMLAQAPACHTCSAVGHQSTLCPTLPFAPPAPLLQLTPLRPDSRPVDSRGRKIELLQRSSPQVHLPSPVSSQQRAPRIQTLISSHLSTPIVISELASLLQSHPDSAYVDFLLTGLSQGFHIGVCAPPLPTLVCPNLQSALLEPDIVSSLLQREVSKGYMIGPLRYPPFSHFRVKPLGVATRKYSGKKRLILDLSAPHSGPLPSINSLIPKPPFSLFYTSVDHAISLIKIAGQGAWLAKADITDAFKVMPVHPSDWHLQGAKWKGSFYFAVRLTFGCRSSPSLFDNLSEALCWILLNVSGVPAVLHLLDDFLLIDHPSHLPSSSLSKLRQLFHQVGVPLSEEKTLGPATSLDFLGITLDSVSMVASLPAEKLSRIREVSRSFESKPIVSKRQLLSLLGHLNFAMRIIPQGRSFISRLLDLANSVPSLIDQVTLDDGCRSDLAFWSKLLSDWNGLSFFYEDVILSADSLQFYTDAAPSSGFGGFFQGKWFASTWPSSLSQSESIAFYEIIPITVACCLWGHFWKRKRISALCDNAAVIHAINKGRSSSNPIMPFIRRITWQAVTDNFIISARHVPGHSNAIADALSRSKLQVFRQLSPDADPLPSPIPSFQDLILN
ncbi:uncharacterized protein LOC112451073 [Kryptolebias marmoratus]|uniref:uncharacterized protein LOC112451073 n=1 Tax=Kryptolebias marmoratus TaxID=37003 RepID=UPI000D530C9D|nr:uncharacterized protein LOC112451073 [Kryptolebias marmoratus]